MRRKQTNAQEKENQSGQVKIKCPSNGKSHKKVKISRIDIYHLSILPIYPIPPLVSVLLPFLPA